MGRPPRAYGNRSWNSAEKIAWSPFPRQNRFLSCPAMEACFGGAAGPGKTDALIVAAIVQANTPGYKAIILRRKMVDLERHIILRSHALLKGRGTYNGQRHVWTFPPHGTTLEFGHVQRPQDLLNYQGAQYSFVGFDELTQFTEGMYLYFFSRLRTVNPDIKIKIRSTTNPGGIGHAWVKKRFYIGEKDIDKCHKVEQPIVYPDGRQENLSYYRAFIPATVFDNPHIMKNDKQYIARLMELPEAQRNALLYGRWDTFDGKFFSEFDAGTHVIKPFDIPPGWRRSISFDWGFMNDHTCVLWFAEDPASGRIFCYRELYVLGQRDEVLAQEICDLSKGEDIHCLFYPWDLEIRSGQTGKSIRERMDDVFIRNEKHWFLQKANRDRKHGWAGVRYLLAKRQDGQPRLQIFDTCENLLRTLPDMVWDENDKEELSDLGEDHAVDALRYFAGTFREVERLTPHVERQNLPVDVGAAWKNPDGTYSWKKTEERETLRFSWME